MDVDGVDSNCSKAAAHPWPTTGGDGMQQMPGTKPRWGQLLATELHQIRDSHGSGVLRQNQQVQQLVPAMAGYPMVLGQVELLG